MPKFRGIDVKIITQDLEPLPEYGFTVRNRHKECSCYIESATDLSFQVKIAADHPFAQGEDRISTYDFDTHDYGLYLSPSRAPKYDPPCPFHLLASIYLDGRHKPERRTIVYLDPAHKHYNDGPTYMRSRWVKHEDGIIKSHKWVFKDAVGIETMLDKMIIAGELPIQGSLDKDQDDLVAALNASTIQAGTRDEDCRDSSVGSIMITVQRVTVGNIKTEKHYQPSHTLKDKEDVDMDGASSHIAKPTEEGDVVSGLQESVQVIEYSPYTLDEEDMYATFKFLYRSKAVLQKFDFPEFALQMKAKPRAGGSRHFSHLMAKTIPLSITDPTKSNPGPRKNDAKSSPSALVLRVTNTDGKLVVSKSLKKGKGCARIGQSSKCPRPIATEDEGSLSEASMDLSASRFDSDPDSSTESDSDNSGSDYDPSRQKGRMIESVDRGKYGVSGKSELSVKSASPDDSALDKGSAFKFVPSSDADADDEDDDGDTDSTSRRHLKPSPFANADKKTLKRPRNLDEDHEAPENEFPSGLAGNKDDEGLGAALEKFTVEHKKLRSSSITISPHEDTSPRFDLARIPDDYENMPLKQPRLAFAKALNFYKNHSEEERLALPWTANTYNSEGTSLCPDKHRKPSPVSSPSKDSVPPLSRLLLHDNSGSFSDASGYFGDKEDDGERTPNLRQDSTNDENRAPVTLMLTNQASRREEDGETHR